MQSNSRETSLSTNLAVALASALAYLVYKYIEKSKECDEREKAYWGERRGRTRVEQEMRKLSNIRLNTETGFYIQPIGTIYSCYRQCVGTPRQGLLAPLSRSSLVLKNNISPESLDGLEEFSHVWLFFKFHHNTNTLKEARAYKGGQVDDNQRKELDEEDAKWAKRTYTFTAKITPPMLKEKKGVFATRSPHRPNPIGVTLAKLESVDKKGKRVLLSACDLVEDTPIFDIKPYVPMYDGSEEYMIPPWITATIDTRNTVVVGDEIHEKVDNISRSLREYKNDSEGYMAALVQTLEVDVRSKFQTKRRMKDATMEIPVEVPFDNTIVKYLWKEERVFEVTDIVMHDEL